MKKTIIASVCFMLLVFLSSCAVQEDGLYGNLTVLFNSRSRAIDCNISLETESYRLTFSGPNGESESSTAGRKTTSVSRKGLAVGEWTVTVEALNEDSVVIGSGSSKVEIKKGTTATADITVTELEGDGTLSVSILGDNPNSSTYTLEVYKNDNGTDTLAKSQVFSSSDSGLNAEVTLPNGYYIIKVVSSTASEQCPVPETVRIVKDDTVSASYTITDGEGSVSITVNNLVSPSPALLLSFSSSIPRIGDSLTVTATGMGDGSYKYEWYLDGTKVTGDGFSTTLGNLTATGDYSVTCIVRDTESSLTWSVSKVLTVYDDSYKPQTITVNGDVEFYLVSDVAVPQRLKTCIKGQENNEEISTSRHFITSFSSETELYCELSGVDGYSYYFETRFLTEKNRTLVYLVIDRELENYGYVHVNAFDTGDFWDPYQQGYQGNILDDEQNFIPVLIYGDSRTIKLECGTYTLLKHGVCANNTRFIYTSYDQTEITIAEGETVELNYSNNYSTYIVNSTEFTEGDYYTVGLMYNGTVGDYTPRFRVSDGKLIIPVSLGQYDSLVLYNVEKDRYFKIDEALSIGTAKEYTAVFSNLEYETKSCNVPAGRVKVKCEVDGLAPGNLSGIYYRLTDSDGASLGPYTLSSKGERTLQLSSDAVVSVTNPLNLGYTIEVTATDKTDESGDYTLVEFKLTESCEDSGTLVVNYSVPDGVTFSNISCSLWLTLSETENEYVLDMQNASTRTFTVRAGTYRRTGYNTTYDSTGKRYRPTLDKESFTVQKGETTTVTVTLVEYDGI